MKFGEVNPKRDANFVEGDVHIHNPRGSSPSPEPPGCARRMMNVIQVLLFLGVAGTLIAGFRLFLQANTEAFESGQPGFSDADYSEAIPFFVVAGILFAILLVLSAAFPGGIERKAND